MIAEQMKEKKREKKRRGERERERERERIRKSIFRLLNLDSKRPQKEKYTLIGNTIFALRTPTDLRHANSATL